VLLGGAGLLLAAAPSAVRARTGAASGWRGRKLATRFAPAVVAAALCAQALAAPGPASIAAGLAGLAAVAWAIRRYRLRGPDRAACAGCPAGPPGAACPGLAPAYLRERAFRRLAGRWIAAETRRGRARTRRDGAAWIQGLP
jgi:hypothetical protein